MELRPFTLGHRGVLGGLYPRFDPTIDGRPETDDGKPANMVKRSEFRFDPAVEIRRKPRIRTTIG